MRRINIIIAACLLLLCSCGQAGNDRHGNGGLQLSEAAARQHSESEAAKDNADDNAETEYSSAGSDTKLSVMLPARRKDLKEQILVREGYTASYNSDNLEPNWVTWQLTAAHCRGTMKRKGIEFHEDEEVPSPRADTYDYMRSGYDRGHMCPAGDNKWSMKAMEQSFLLTNVCPQNSNLNRGDWNEIETLCRSWARKYGSVYITCGPIYLNKKHKRIGKHKVVVPDAFFKVVLTLGDSPKSIGFICRNTDGNRPKDAYVNSVDDVERITGYNFFAGLDKKIQDKVERQADLNDW